MAIATDSEGVVVVKITADNHVFHRVKVAPTVQALRSAATEAGLRGVPTYVDADGDQCVILSDEILGEALACASGPLKVAFVTEAGEIQAGSKRKIPSLVTRQPGNICAWNWLQKGFCTATLTYL